MIRRIRRVNKSRKFLLITFILLMTSDSVSAIVGARASVNICGLIVFALCILISAVMLKEKTLKQMIKVNIILSLLFNIQGLFIPSILTISVLVTSAYLGTKIKKHIKKQPKITKTVTVLLFLATITSNFFAVHMEWSGATNDIHRAEGFMVIKPLEFSTLLTTNGNFSSEFVNTGGIKMEVTALNIRNQESGYCPILEKPIGYKSTSENLTIYKLPHTLNSGEVFTIIAKNCAPKNPPPKQNENYQLEVTINYTSDISGKPHTEKGTIYGTYE